MCPGVDAATFGVRGATTGLIRRPEDRLLSHVAVSEQLRPVGVKLWAHVDLNHGPHPYQGCALTGLSYGPRLVAKVGELYRLCRGRRSEGSEREVALRRRL